MGEYMVAASVAGLIIGIALIPDKVKQAARSIGKAGGKWTRKTFIERKPK